VPGAGRRDWSALISEQEASGQEIRAFCQQRGIDQSSFYRWRKRLRNNQPVRFAVLEPKEEIAARAPSLEVILAGGDRLRMTNGVDAATLRLVLDTLRR
jgi:transposase-like protein